MSIDDLRPIAERSFERIGTSDLVRLAELARADREDRFKRRPRWRQYEERLICVALCQGAALHFLDGTTGVKDFDVWSFFTEIPGSPFPPRWRTTADFGLSRLGRREAEPDGRYTGRRIDLYGRSVQLENPVPAQEAIAGYLAAGRTESARMLATKAVVLLDPEPLRGVVVWGLGAAN